MRPTCVMGIADTINILLYASPSNTRTCQDPASAGSLWDVFDAKDANSVRAFLREQHPELGHEDVFEISQVQKCVLCFVICQRCYTVRLAACHHHVIVEPETLLPVKACCNTIRD